MKQLQIFKRYKVNNPRISASIIDGEKNVPFQIKDISLSGICLNHEKVNFNKTNYIVEITDGETKIHLSAKIIWKNQGHIALMFQNIKIETLQTWSKILNKKIIHFKEIKTRKLKKEPKRKEGFRLSSKVHHAS